MPAALLYRSKRIGYNLSLTTWINDARASGDYDEVLLVDDSDVFQGAPVSNLNEGAALRACLDLMGYDAVALGNHEFDWGLEVTARRTGR